jgi:hypothetical protein
LWLSVHLKKQSQFAPGLIGATSYVKGDYDNKQASGAEKTKPILRLRSEQVLFVLSAAFCVIKIEKQTQFWLIEHVQAFLDCVLADELDFFGCWIAVDGWMQFGFVAWVVLVHDVDGCFWTDLPG